MDRAERYKEAMRFIEGVKTMELMEDNPLDLSIQKNQDNRHWSYHLLIPTSNQYDLVYNSSNTEKKPNYQTFGVYLHRVRNEVVAKASIWTSDGNNTRNMLCNNLADELRKRGFRKISYDLKRVRNANAYYPKMFIKVLIGEQTGQELFKLYEVIKHYNNEWFKEWKGTF